MKDCSAPGACRLRAPESRSPRVRPSSALSSWLSFGKAANHWESSFLFWRAPIRAESSTRRFGSVHDSPLASKVWKNGEAESATELRIAMRNQRSEERL